MKIFTSRWMLSLIMAVIVISCSNDASIDKEYLQSEDYRQFKERQEQGYSVEVKNEKLFKDYLAEFGQCKLGRKWDYPIQIDNRILKHDFQPCNRISKKYRTDFTSNPIGYSTFADVIIRWIMIYRESVYTDAELLACTYRDGALISYKTIGLFQNDLKKEVSTKILINRKGKYLIIHSSMDRSIKYPLKIDNAVQSAFRIDTLGSILNLDEHIANSDE